MGKDITKITTTFEFCDGGSCQKAKSELAVREARAYLRNEKLWDTTHTIRTRCNGRCEDAPTWIVQPGNYWYKNLTPEKAVTIVKSHIEKQEPIKDFLLYKAGDTVLNTENEKTVKPIVFKEKTDTDYGDALVARAFASDQYIYPLFQKLFNTENNLEIIFSGEKHFIDIPLTVNYTDDFDITIKGHNINFKLAIGAITKAMEEKIAPEILERKLGVSEVIWLKNNPTLIGAIRLKNRKGKHLLTINIPKENTSIWNYILEIYLSMDLQNPRIISNLSTHES
ncbi:hypothetical protein A8C32_08155 [Flavivirga aquatica]|uniref:(2Fe-2S) ferredoxin domain-containing protein n=1 Tax=Flavivirga aquatica TaxID=1849968 RepID=A0A1E5SJ39_9FLAO|nr:(2Fe-2S) ferredoxin domain-containing protein [Flavivirga aquatica]OEJ99138.1 hypothetical protein A8C32_08155 [Flavivirga aquatica]